MQLLKQVTIDEHGTKYRLITTNGIPLNELKGSGEEKFSNTGSEATRIFHTPWRSRGGLATELLGGVAVIGTTLQRFMPDRHPDFTWLVCDDVVFRPIGRPHTGSKNQPLYKRGCLATATYRSPSTESDLDEVAAQDPTNQEIQLVTEELTFSSEFQTIPGTGFYYNIATNAVEANKKLYGDQPVGMLVGTVEIQYTRHLVPRIPYNTIRDTVGKVNNAVFPPNSAYPAGIETLLFLGLHSKRQFTSGGTKAAELVYKFKRRTAKTRSAVGGAEGTGYPGGTRPADMEAGWNRVWVSKWGDSPVNDWLRIWTLSGDRTIYELADFTKLFDPKST